MKRVCVAWGALLLLLAVSATPSPRGSKLPVPHSRDLRTHRYAKTEVNTHQPRVGEDIRLPTALKPVSYVVRLQPLLEGNFTIFGYVEVEFEVLEPTSNVTLHIQDIVTQNDTVRVALKDDVTGPGLTISSHSYDSFRQFYTASLGEELVVGQNYVLSMDFIGFLNDGLAGFYRSTYTDPDGNVRTIAITQFEATDARKAFPCFDEPTMKATFDVILGRQTNMTSISNMPLTASSPIEGQPGWVWDYFNTSVPMSTYLVAFCITDFVYLSSNYNDHVLFRVWLQEAMQADGQQAIETGPPILTNFEDYFNILYPLPKQDMIAIPDFAAGAMENWGLITYRESALLYNPAEDPNDRMQYVNSVIAHELAHQWFGNLVTMKWWNDLWLNEGFATFLEYIGVDSIEPTWRMRELMVTYDMHYVFERDSLESSHPISFDVTMPNEIDAMFNTITYSKGGSIIRMMNYFLMEETFRKGLYNYLTTLQYSNAAQDDLWQFLTDAGHADGTLPSEMTVKMIMDTWTLQKGYPVISVTRDAAGTSASVTQERFVTDANPNSTDTHDYKWWVPLTYTTQVSPDFNFRVPDLWMMENQTEVTVSSLPAADQWVIFNIQETGYYRVNYDLNNWNLLIQQLSTNPQVFHTLNRAQMIDDTLDFALEGVLSYDVALGVSSYLVYETEYFPWDAAMDNLEYLESMLTFTPAFGAIKNYLLTSLVTLYNSVGFEDSITDELLEIYSRMIAVSWTCHFDYQDCVTKSVALYQQWMADPSNTGLISANTEYDVYCTAIAAGGEAEWDFAWLEYLNADRYSDYRYNLEDALACSKDQVILTRLLDRAFTVDSGIFSEDSYYVFRSVARNDLGRDLAWDYLNAQYQSIANFYGNYNMMGSLANTASYEYNTEEGKTKLEVYKQDHADTLTVGGISSVNSAISRTDDNIAWMTAYYDTIYQWLLNNGYGARKNTLAV